MARTLIISDLHLGAYVGHCVLLRPAVLEALVEHLQSFDRLVLLGDVIELGERRPVDEVLAIAAPVLSALGAALGGPAPEIVCLAGNHDRALVQPFIDARGTDLGLDEIVPHDASPALAQMVALLSAGGARVSVHYPFFRLSERVWLHHGHYLDRLIRPEGPYGFWPRPGMARPVDYEQGRIPQSKPGVVQLIQHRVLQPRFARVTTAGLNWQMRRHSLPALARATGALGLDADYLVFGHVHRLGPLPGDRLRQWESRRGPGQGAMRFVNTGSWVEDELLIGDMRPPHPYWPGGAVAVEADGIPHPYEPLSDALFLADAVAARFAHPN